MCLFLGEIKLELRKEIYNQRRIFEDLFAIFTASPQRFREIRRMNVNQCDGDYFEVSYFLSCVT